MFYRHPKTVRCGPQEGQKTSVAGALAFRIQGVNTGVNRATALYCPRLADPLVSPIESRIVPR